MINPMPSDAEVESWFMLHASEANGVSDRILLPIAPWIPIISFPANDR